MFFPGHMSWASSRGTFVHLLDVQIFEESIERARSEIQQRIPGIPQRMRIHADTCRSRQYFAFFYSIEVM